MNESLDALPIPGGFRAGARPTATTDPVDPSAMDTLLDDVDEVASAGDEADDDYSSTSTDEMRDNSEAESSSALNSNNKRIRREYSPEHPALKKIAVDPEVLAELQEQVDSTKTQLRLKISELTRLENVEKELLAKREASETQISELRGTISQMETEQDKAIESQKRLELELEKSRKELEETQRQLADIQEDEPDIFSVRDQLLDDSDENIDIQEDEPDIFSVRDQLLDDSDEDIDTPRYRTPELSDREYSLIRELEDTKIKASATEKEFEELRAALEALRLQTSSEREKPLAELQTKSNEHDAKLVEERHQHASKVADLERRERVLLEELQKARDSRTEQTQKLKEDLNASETKLNALSSDLEKVKKERVEDEGRIKRLEDAELEASKLGEQIATLQEQSKARRDQDETQIQSLQMQLQNKSNEHNAKLAEERRHHASKVADLERRERVLLEELQKARDSRTEQTQKLKEDLNASETKLNALFNDLETTKKERVEDEGRIKRLEDAELEASKLGEQIATLREQSNTRRDQDEAQIQSLQARLQTKLDEHDAKLAEEHSNHSDKVADFQRRERVLFEDLQRARDQVTELTRKHKDQLEVSGALSKDLDKAKIDLADEKLNSLNLAKRIERLQAESEARPVVDAARENAPNHANADSSLNRTDRAQSNPLPFDTFNETPEEFYGDDPNEESILNRTGPEQSNFSPFGIIDENHREDPDLESNPPPPRSQIASEKRPVSQSNALDTGNRRKPSRGRSHFSSSTSIHTAMMTRGAYIPQNIDTDDDEIPASNSSTGNTASSFFNTGPSNIQNTPSGPSNVQNAPEESRYSKPGSYRRRAGASRQVTPGPSNHRRESDSHSLNNSAPSASSGGAAVIPTMTEGAQATPPPSMPNIDLNGLSAESLGQVLKDFMTNSANAMKDAVLSELRGNPLLSNAGQPQTPTRRSRETNPYSPYKPPGPKRPRTSARTEIMNYSRQLQQKLLGLGEDDDIFIIDKKHLAHPDEVDKFERSQRDPPALEPLQLYFDCVKTKWNAYLATLFAERFLQLYSNLGATSEEIQDHFMTRLNLLRERLISIDHIPGETQLDVLKRYKKEREPVNAAKRIRTRQYNLYVNRYEDCADRTADSPLNEGIAQVIKTLGIDGMSEDETEDEDNMLVRSTDWRNPKLLVALKHADKMHPTTNISGSRKTGNRAYNRKRQRHAPKGVQKPPQELPENFYFRTWLNTLSLYERGLLKAKPPMPFYGENEDDNDNF